jgi:bis(5'-nucleosidyl)-tetraphosphatase
MSSNADSSPADGPSLPTPSPPKGQSPESFTGRSFVEPLHACGFIMFRRRGDGWDFLLLRHTERWDLPKGLREIGESEWETAYRELFEETGISRELVVAVPGFRFEHEYIVPSFNGRPTPKRLTIFLGILAQEVTIQLTEHHASQWFEWAPPHAIEPKNVDSVLAAVQASGALETLP